MVKTTANGNVTGMGPELKATQVYPWGYAQALLAAYLEHNTGVEVVGSDGSDTEVDSNLSISSDPWDDADLAELENLMGLEHAKLPADLAFLKS